ncbi:MAG TPA: hypothetical protein VHS32_14160 [Streptosporangiaceae bacterium]|nr:hypothetical protein [Streptosporangiaceae bacterium]
MRLPATRGRLQVYLGVAPGAGATCALLSEGHRRAEQGADVVVAGVQTGGRPRHRRDAGRSGDHSARNSGVHRRSRRRYGPRRHAGTQTAGRAGG